MTDKQINKSVKWYLQKEHNLFAEAFVPQEFWDTYLHAGCNLIKEQNENPFEEKRNG